jgi:hypothetical protein
MTPFRTICLAAEDGHILSKDQQLDVLCPTRPTAEKKEAEELPVKHGDETEDYEFSFAGPEESSHRIGRHAIHQGE